MTDLTQEIETADMFIEREAIEKLLTDKGNCTLHQFRQRCSNNRWRVGAYKACIKTILVHYGISDEHGNGTDQVVRFLNGGEPHHEIRSKRKQVDWSMAESSDDEEGFGPSTMDISASTVLSLDESAEVLELKRLLCEAEKENKGIDI